MADLQILYNSPEHVVLSVLNLTYVNGTYLYSDENAGTYCSFTKSLHYILSRNNELYTFKREEQITYF